MLLTSRRLGVITATAVVLMAFARVYVGAHFPLDVIVGLPLGAAVTCAGHLAMRTPLSRVVTGLTRTPLRPLLTADRSLSR